MFLQIIFPLFFILYSLSQPFSNWDQEKPIIVASKAGPVVNYGGDAAFHSLSNPDPQYMEVSKITE
jgi:hypothetical protein